MDIAKPSTAANLEAAFGGESMANRKYLFFAEVAIPPPRKPSTPSPTSGCYTRSW